MAMFLRRFTGKDRDGFNLYRVIFTRLGIGNEKKLSGYLLYSVGVNANAAEMGPDHC